MSDQRPEFKMHDAVKLGTDPEGVDFGIILNPQVDSDDEYNVLACCVIEGSFQDLGDTYWSADATHPDPNDTMRKALGAKDNAEPEVSRVFVAFAAATDEVHTYLDLDALVELNGEDFRPVAMKALVEPGERVPISVKQRNQSFDAGWIAYAPVHRKTEAP